MKKKYLFIIPFFSLLVASCSNSNTNTSSTVSQTTISTTSATTSSSTTQISSSVTTPTSSSTPETVKHKVRFFVDGVIIFETEVKDGDLVTPPTNPSKDPDKDADKYVFAGWDRDVGIPITRDVDFNAIFDAYSNKIEIENFESYTVDNELADNGWFAIGYNGSWTKETSASVSLTKNAADGNQALRFDCFKNDSPFMIRKEIEENNIDKCSNAINFKMMAPTGANLCRVLLTLPVEDPQSGLIVDATIKHDFELTTAEYFECTIPFAADGWLLWDNPINLKEDTKAYGINCDRIPTMLTKIEFCLRYSSHSPSNYLAFLDSVNFLTIDENETEIKINEYFDIADTYTGKTLQGQTIKLDVDKKTYLATATLIDERPPLSIDGKISIENNQIKFQSNEANLLSYNGRLTNGGQKIIYVSAEGDYKNVVAEMNMDSVQIVDNFEQYDTDGVSYHAENTEDDRSGCRGNYYSEYYKGSGSSPWGKSGWSLMEGDHNQLSMGTDGGHTGNNYLRLKRSNNVMRYMQWDLSKGTTDTKAYRGDTFSFWVKATGSGVIDHIKMYFYSQSSPVINTMDERVKTLDLLETISTSKWTHYTIKLDPEQVYYGFLIHVYGNSTNTSYLLLDDLEVYTANPYSTSVDGISLSKSSAKLTVGFQEELLPTITPVDAGNKNINWTTNNTDVVTVDNKGIVTAVGSGNATITATTVDGHFEATCDFEVKEADNFPVGTYKGIVAIDNEVHTLVISLGLQSKGGLVASNIDSQDISATSVSYNSETKIFEISTQGKFLDKTCGKIIGEYNQTHNKLTNISFDGEISEIIIDNGAINMPKLTTNECDGTTKELQEIFRRRYKYNWGNWQIDNTNDDRISKNGTKYVAGTSAVKLRPYEGTGNATSISLIKDYQTPKKVSNIQFWVYNSSSDTDISLNVWVYKSEGYATAIEVTSATKTAIALNRNNSNNNYVYVSLSFAECEIYNWQIADMNGTNGTLSFDNIAVF